MMIPKNQHKPRLWVRLLLNPFIHKKKKGSIIRNSVRLDVFPYNAFALGCNSIVEDFSTINNGVGHVYIGDKTIIGLGSVIIGPVKIGDGVMLAQNIVLSGLNHCYENVDLSPSLQAVTSNQIFISDDVWIGANVVVTAGVTIGKHSVIGAGSVVTKDVPDFCVAVGNPARVVKKYDSKLGLWTKV